MLRSYYDQSQATGISLYETLKAANTSALSGISNGRFLINASANGQQYGWQIPGQSSPLNPQYTSEVPEKLLEIYEDLKPQRTTFSLPTDDESMFWAMMADDRMQQVSIYQDDFTLIRWGAIGRAGF